jgi:AraC-like DNA-binding protein
LEPIEQAMVGMDGPPKETHWESPPVQDALTAVVDSLGMRGRLFCRIELSAPWGMAFPRNQLARFHVIERGSCWLKVQGSAQPVTLASGDLVVVPHGNGHSLVDSPDTPPVPLSRIVRKTRPGEHARVRHSAGGPQTVLICGEFGFERREGHPLISALPPVIHLRGTSGSARSLLDSGLQLLAAEAKRPRAGTQALVSRLTDVLFIQALRAWVEALPDGAGGWLGALRDRQIGSALSRMHREPDHRWTLASIAAAVGMSRSRFTDRFAALVGEAPMAYLTRWRMQLAAGRLHSGGPSVAELAQSVGYESETAFAKAFRRTFGLSPSAYRRRQGFSSPPARGFP